MEFTFETVDASNVGGRPCLALDSHGNPRIAYVTRSGQLMFASKGSGTWTHEAVLSAGLLTRSETNRICLQIDSRGNPHIAGQAVETGHLLYGVKEDGRWAFAPVPTRLGRLDPGGVVGYDFRLHYRRDTPELQDTPHFVFHDLSTRQLGYARKLDGRFKLTVAAASGDNSKNGLFPSMAFDAVSGTFLFAYVEELDLGEGTPPITRVGLNRILDPVDGTLGTRTVLKEDRFDVVRPTSVTSDWTWCVAYADGTTRRLLAFVLEPSLPEPHQELVATTTFPVVASVAHAAGRGFRIVYGDDNELKLASRNRFGEWIVEGVDGDGADMPTLVCDGAGVAHIAYVAGSALKYARGSE